MDDLISRQAAIMDAESWVAVDEYEKNLQKNVVEWLKEFPPAELGTDTISRQAAIKALHDEIVRRRISEDTNDNGTLDEFDTEAILRQLPSAQPEIIRCKDCKHWIPYDWMFSEVWQSKNIADYPEDEMGCDCCDMAMKANDFCSRGERRTDG